MPKYITTEYKGKGYVCRIHKPILSAEERKKREEACKKSIVEFYKETGGKNGV